MKSLFFISFLLLGCGTKKAATIPIIDNNPLQTQINRITPLLNWCDGQTCGSGNNHIDGRVDCGVGDGAFTSGFISIVGSFENKQETFSALSNSFGVSGAPFRAPSYVDKDPSDQFSRDQLLGFLEATITGLPRENGIDKIMDYYNRTGSLCSNPSDNKCELTPKMKVLIKRVQGESITELDKLIEAASLKIESATVPSGYQIDLVMRYIFAITKMNALTTTMASAAKTIYNRAPNNLWWKTVYLVTNNGSSQDFKNVSDKLAVCMERWIGPGKNWAWQEEYEDCPISAYGSEYVALGHFLLSESKVASIVEDDSEAINNLVGDKGGTSILN